ncbi:MAG: alpha/beta fold hydrolase [Burkholderiales bacterium]|nr:alpha/beta fold hydrolase [Burkholderiales bacterium]
MRAYRAPAWLPGGHAQTIVPALLGRRPAVGYARERWPSRDGAGREDGDFVDVDWIADADGQPRWIPGAPLVVLFHGLEGSSRSAYSCALMSAVAARGWNGCVPHFRGCSGEINRLPRAYHSGDSDEIDWILATAAARRPGVLFAAGVSLGGNALMKWAGERGARAARTARAVAAVCSPLDLAASGHALARGFNRLYTRMFLRTLKAKSEAKLARFPGLFDGTAMRRARDLYAFDNIVTAPLHGFRDTDDYWARASAQPWLRGIEVPALVLNARNDPFVPAASLPGPGAVSPSVTLDQPEQGGHVGFGRPAPLGVAIDWLPDRLLSFFESHQ